MIRARLLSSFESPVASFGRQCARKWRALSSLGTVEFDPSHILLVAEWRRRGREERGGRGIDFGESEQAGFREAGRQGKAYGGLMVFRTEKWSSSGGSIDRVEGGEYSEFGRCDPNFGRRRLFLQSRSCRFLVKKPCPGLALLLFPLVVG